jgi:hypothetical protein
VEAPVRRISAVFVLVLLSLTLMPQAVSAALEWNVQKQLTLEAAPREVIPSADGKSLYVLIAGQIIVYSVPEYKVISRFPLEKTYDRLAYSAQDNTLIVSSSSDKTVKIIQLDMVHEFSLEGAPFKGPRNARVTLVVFSDYQ